MYTALTIDTAGTKPGDLVGFQTSGFFATLIKFGQRIGRVKHWKITHIACVEEVHPQSNDLGLIQAVRRVNRVTLDSYGNTPCEIIAFPGPDDERPDVVRYLQAMVGLKYGVLVVISRAINYLTPKWVRVTGERKGRMDCSVIGARAWEHGGYIFPAATDVWQITPGNLADWFAKDAA